MRSSHRGTVRSRSGRPPATELGGEPVEVPLHEAEPEGPGDELVSSAKIDAPRASTTDHPLGSRAGVLMPEPPSSSLQPAANSPNACLSSRFTPSAWL